MREMILLLLSLFALTGIIGCKTTLAESKVYKEVSPPNGKLGDLAIPLHYDIHLTVDPNSNTFEGQSDITVDLTKESKHIWLHGKSLEVSSASVITGDNEILKAQYEEVLPSGVAKVSFPQRLLPGTITLKFKYRAEYGQTGGGLFKMEENGQTYVASQFQTIHARRVFPGFDEPRFKPTFTVSLTTPEGMTAVTNSPVKSRMKHDGMVTHQFFTSAPMPTYLVAFMVGPYDIAQLENIPPNSVRDKSIRLRALVAEGKESKAEYALKNTDAILSWLEEYFGSPYPYQKIDLIAPPGSLGFAMENPGALLYDEYLLLLDENSPLFQKGSYAIYHSHELAHMWFGNLVTPKWWDDLWLNESFATWMAYKSAQQFWPEGDFSRAVLGGSLYAMSKDSLANTQSVKQPVDSNEAISYALDGEITYSKGAGILRMLENLIGERDFKLGIREHMRRFKQSTADSDDFIKSLLSISEQQDIDDIFHSFITLPGVPLVEADLRCSKGEMPSVALKQSRYTPMGSELSDNQLWTIPVCITDGHFQTCTIMTEKDKVVKLETQQCPSYIHANANGGYYRFSLTQQGWESLITHADSLSAEQALVMADSLDASLRNGTVSAAVWLSGILALSSHQSWDVVESALNKFESMLSDALSTEHMDKASALSYAVFKPVYSSFSSKDSTGAIMLSEKLQEHLLQFSKDSALRLPLVQKAEGIAARENEDVILSLDVKERKNILTVGVEDLGSPFFKLLDHRMEKYKDPALKANIVAALANTTDLTLANQLLDGIVGGKYEDYGPTILEIQLSQKQTRENAYAWLKRNAGKVLNLIPDSARGRAFPPIVSDLCSKDRARDWEQFILSRKDNMPGYERSLGQTLEKIRLCAALKETHGEALAEAIQIVQ